MALDRFRASPLPNPPAQYDPQYVRQLIRVIELYFSQLDSRAANNAEQYSADRFIGGSFSGTSIDATDVNTDTFEALSGHVDYLTTDVTNSTYTDTDALHAHSAEITTLMGDKFYGGAFYGDGRWLETPYNQFWHDADQTAANTYTAYAVNLNQDDFPNGITISNNSRINFSDPGVYLINYSLSFTNNTNDTQEIDIWFRYEGNDIASSNSRFTIPARKSTGSNSYLIAVTPYMVDIIAANDYIEIMWKVSDTGVSMEYLAAVAANPGVTPAIPATPSAIVTVQFVSAQHPPATRIAPLPVFGFGQVGDISVVTS